MCRTPNYPTRPTRSRAAARRRGLNAPLVGPHSAIQARRSSRVLEAYAWAGRAEHTARFSCPVRCVQMLIMLMGRRFSFFYAYLSCGASIEKLRSAFVLFLYSASYTPNLLFAARGSLPRGPESAKGTDPRASKHTENGRY